MAEEQYSILFNLIPKRENLDKLNRATSHTGSGSLVGSAIGASSGFRFASGFVAKDYYGAVFKQIKNIKSAIYSMEKELKGMQKNLKSINKDLMAVKSEKEILRKSNEDLGIDLMKALKERDKKYEEGVIIGSKIKLGKSKEPAPLPFRFENPNPKKLSKEEAILKSLDKEESFQYKPSVSTMLATAPNMGLIVKGGAKSKNFNPYASKPGVNESIIKAQASSIPKDFNLTEKDANRPSNAKDELAATIEKELARIRAKNQRVVGAQNINPTSSASDTKKLDRNKPDNGESNE